MAREKKIAKIEAEAFALLGFVEAARLGRNTEQAKTGIRRLATLKRRIEALESA